jgi:rhamnosyltransferase
VETVTDALHVAAVVVTYRPDRDRLDAVLARLKAQVAHIVVVDNGDGSAPREQAVRHGATLIPLGVNRGIGSAQNIGAHHALGRGATDLLLMDQDSLPAIDLVERLLDARFAAELHLPVAAVGAASYGPHGADGFVTLGRFGYVTLRPRPGTAYVECNQLIASGCLIRADAWTQIGGMDESLFIDRVDTEWCLRARRQGRCVVGAPQARLDHRLGGARVRLWFGRWREFPLHDATRYYYMARNTVLLARGTSATSRWRCAATRHELKQLFAVGVLGVAGPAARRMWWSGLRDGWRGVRGPFHPRQN